MTLTIKPKKIAFALGVAICLLILAGILGSIARYQFGVTDSFIVNLFNLDSEKNVPTYFATFLLLSSALLLFIVGYARKKQAARDYWQWIGLGAVFIFLSMDEFIEIHEVIGTAIQNKYQPTGVFYFAWIIPYAVFAIGMAIAYLPFLFRLPAKFIKLFILAGFLYVMGALGLEAVASYFNYETGERGVYFVFLTTLEESMEMFGLLLFIYALLHYMDVILGRLSLVISDVQAEAFTTTEDHPRHNHPKAQQTTGSQMLR